MESVQRTRCILATAAVAAWLAWPAAPAIADDVSLKLGGGAAGGSLSSAGRSTGVGAGADARSSGSGGLDLNPLTDDQLSSSRNFQSTPLNVPDGLDRFSIRGGDSKGNVSLIYKVVKTKF